MFMQRSYKLLACNGSIPKKRIDNSNANKINEILSKVCFVYSVTFFWKGFLSSEITQIVGNLMKKGLRQVIFMGCITF